MTVHRLPDREVPPMPPYTTLELLEKEHKRLKERAAVGFGESPRTPAQWHEHLAKVLRINVSK